MFTRMAMIAMVLLGLMKCHTSKFYYVTSNQKFKHKFRGNEKDSLPLRDLRSITCYYYVSKDISEDSVKLKSVARKIFRKHHKTYLYNYFDTCNLVFENDSIAYFDYHFRKIHGYETMIFNKTKGYIKIHKAYTGNF
jgi:hypothetical protein